MQLSEYQREVIKAAGNQNLIVNAVAGSGKTFTLMKALEKVATLNPNSRIMLCAFNVHIREELKQKAKEMGLGVQEWDSQARRFVGNVTVKNMHGIGFDFVKKKFGKKFDVDQYKYTEILREISSEYDEPDEEVFPFLCDLWDKVRLTLTDITNKKAVLGVMNHFRLDGPIDWAFDKLPQLREYGIESTKNEHVVDFTDMLWIPGHLKLWGWTYDFLFVDEAQDLSPALHYIVEKSLKKGGKILAVGDPRQAIMGFAGASSNSFYEMKDRFNCTELPLSICYRCPTSHIEVVNRQFPEIPFEASPTATEGEIKDISWGDVPSVVVPGDLIYSPVNRYLISMAFQLLSEGKGVKVIGVGIGPKLVKEIKKIERKITNFSEFPTAVESAKESKLAKMRKKAKGNLEPSVVEEVENFYAAIMVIYESSGAKSVYEMVDIVERMFNSRDDEPDSSLITLSSVHRAKGLESERVFFLNIDPAKGYQLCPSVNAVADWDIEQQNNLLYVALTRGKEVFYNVRQ